MAFTEWPTGTPESQGLASEHLDALAALALKHGGGSGCVVRHGVLVKEWGDPKSLADIKSAMSKKKDRAFTRAATLALKKIESTK